MASASVTVPTRILARRIRDYLNCDMASHGAPYRLSLTKVLKAIESAPICPGADADGHHVPDPETVMMGIQDDYISVVVKCKNCECGGELAFWEKEFMDDSFVDWAEPAPSVTVGPLDQE